MGFASLKGLIWFFGTIRRAEKFLKFTKSPENGLKTSQYCENSVRSVSAMCAFFRKTIVWSKRTPFNSKTFSAWKGFDSFKIPFGH